MFNLKGKKILKFYVTIFCLSKSMLHALREYSQAGNDFFSQIYVMSVGQ